MYNKIDANKHLSNKKGLFISMRDYYYAQGLDPFDVLPLTILINPDNKEGDLKRFEQHNEQLKREIEEKQEEKKAFIAIRRREIKEMRNFKEMQRAQELQHVNQGHANWAYDEEEEEEPCYEEYERDPILKQINTSIKVPKTIWIVKPGENSNRGNGINLCSTIPEIKKLVGAN